ncbi:MAG: acetate kinase [Cardiobacteriaceae bacterium]|nr:acetate kinase [Cardiobacteriaceae bacterium]
MKKYVLVINCGSSSLKFALIEPNSGESPLKGNAEHLGFNDGKGTISLAIGEEKIKRELNEESTHDGALHALVEILKSHSMDEDIYAIGHRIVHGGEYFSDAVVVDDDVRAKIAECSRLAPLHNPAHILGIDAARHNFPHLQNVVVFDTAFHQQIPEKAYLYALPYRFYTDYHIRKYGFHGTSYRYISTKLPEITGKEHNKAIVCHLGNGGSVAAIDGDHSVDTTMGLTPLEGIVHGTRCGDIDPVIHDILTNQFEIPASEISNLLWKQSGLLGLSGISNHCGELEELSNNGNEAAKRAIEVYCYRLAKHIAGQFVALGGCEILVFTGGIGEKSRIIRRRTIEQLGVLGFYLDNDRNNDQTLGKTRYIHAQNSTPIWIIPTNEELMIARDTARLCA